MKKMNKMALAAVAASALAATAAHAQYNNNANELLLGFTTAASTGDLVIDLGTASSITSLSGTTDLNAHGNTGFSASALAAALGQNGLSINGLTWGVVGGSSPNAANQDIFFTVAHGAPKPSAFPNYTGVADVDSAGFSITSGKNAVVDPTQGTGTSFSEAIAAAGGSGSFVTDTGKTPTTKTPASGAFSVSEDLYESIKGSSSTVFEGTFTFDNLGNFSFTPVPEPATYGLLAGLGLLALTVRRQFTRKLS